jgi:hypothetical protein
MNKTIFIELEVQDGNRSHTHKVLHETNGIDIEFAALRYVATFWGKGSIDGEWGWFDGEFAARLVQVKEVPNDELTILKKYI